MQIREMQQMPPEQIGFTGSGDKYGRDMDADTALDDPDRKHDRIGDDPAAVLCRKQ